MSVIAIEADPQGATRVFFDCRDAPPDPADEQWIERAMAAALAPDRVMPAAHAAETAFCC